VWARHDLDWALDTSSSECVDVLCLQETKLHNEQLSDDMKAPPGFVSYWSFGQRKGYSGTAILVRDHLAVKPLAFSVGGSEHPEYDAEGRVVALDVCGVAVVCVYCPNGGSSNERLQFKHAWHEAFLHALAALKRSHAVVVLGDFNVAHRPIDVEFPERWANQSGFLLAERAWFDRLLAAGFVDTFRAERGDVAKQYTFWETRVDARRYNQGWRIDYVVVSEALREQVTDAFISAGILGSDHCPVGIELEVATGARSRASFGADPAGEPSSDTFDDDDDGGFRR
jgi:exodeoxyribonuclease-3